VQPIPATTAVAGSGGERPIRIPGERSDNFDLLRAVGALLALFSHSFALTGRPEPPVPGTVTYGGLGVAIFFCISGYLIAQSWHRDPRLFAFLTKRALRILPALVVVVLLCAFVIGPMVTALPVTDYIRSPATWHYLHNIRLYMIYQLPGVFENLPVPNAVNGSLWTLPIEFCMYLIVAVLGVALGGRPSAYAATFLVLVALALFWIPGQPAPIPYFGMDVRYLAILGTYYFAGACLFAFGLDRRLSAPALAVMATSLLTAYWIPQVFTAILWLALPAFVITLGRAPSRLGGWISRHGDLSYGLYVYAFPVQQTLLYYWPSPPLAPYIVAVVVITLAFAYLSWHLIEKPALSLKPRVTGRRREGADAEARAERTIAESRPL
jgi:peptidoglycan/LPS O-acetylase OafA/YrhL